MKLNWKYINLIVLNFQILICFLGTFYKHISFGLGLGDLLFYGFFYISTIVHIIATLKTKEIEHYKSLAIMFLVILTLICLKATIWRSSEYAWNGELFYSN